MDPQNEPGCGGGQPVEKENENENVENENQNENESTRTQTVEVEVPVPVPVTVTTTTVPVQVPSPLESEPAAGVAAVDQGGDKVGQIPTQVAGAADVGMQEQAAATATPEQPENAAEAEAR